MANGGKVDLVALKVSPQRVAELVADHNRTIVEKRRDVRNQQASAAAELWRVLLKPAAHLLSSERLVVVPDGAMHELNLETVIDEQGNYLIDSKIVVNAPSFAVLSSATEVSARANDALIVGDPLQVDPDFPRLTYASQELGALRRISITVAGCWPEPRRRQMHFSMRALAIWLHPFCGPREGEP